MGVCMKKQAIAIRHVHFEDLGAYEPVLRDAGYEIRYCEAGLDQIAEIAAGASILIVLGAPIGAYEEDKYPFLTAELDLLQRRLADRRPVLGICLGAQLIARALGARVYPGQAKEIGWSPLQLTETGRNTPLVQLEALPVLHWHGDTFGLPEGAERLASTPMTVNQAFSYGAAALALQFHAEVESFGFERWLIGHSVEIAGVPGLSVAALRRDAARFAGPAAAAGALMLRAWLGGLPAQ